MSEKLEGEVLEIERFQLWIQRANEIFVEPLCFLDLKAYPFDRFELLSGEVYYEAYA
jgi:hypothetical protein